jgi:hypothetical protein
MGESLIHQPSQREPAGYPISRLTQVIFTANDPEIHRLIRSVVDYGTMSIRYGNQLFKRGDICFG